MDIYSWIPLIENKSTKEKEVIEQIKSLLANYNLPKPDFDSVKRNWDKASPKIFSEIEKIMPDKKHVLKKVTIFPTILGTTCSFNWTPNKDRSMFIYICEDQDVYAITEAILTALTRKDVYNNLNGTWAESELLVDWLLTKSSLSQILKKFVPNSNFVPTLKGTLVKQHAKLLKRSEEFYRKLGLPADQTVFEIKGPELTIHDQPIRNLTPTEKIILKFLIEKANNVASFDELGDVLFKTDDNFSLYAISKQIERLRNKLEENGISGSYIQTLRGQGYLLKN